MVSIFVPPLEAAAGVCQTVSCVEKALISYDRTVLKINANLFSQAMKLGSKYIVPAAVRGTAVPAEADGAYEAILVKFVVANQKASEKLFSKVPQDEVSHFIGIDFGSRTTVDFLYQEADAMVFNSLLDIYAF